MEKEAEDVLKDLGISEEKVLKEIKVRAARMKVQRLWPQRNMYEDQQH